MVNVTSFAKKDRFIEHSREKTVLETVVSSGNSEVTTITADANQIWKIVAVIGFVGSPSGASSGNHTLRFGQSGESGSDLPIYWEIVSNYDSSINKQVRSLATGSYKDSDYTHVEVIKLEQSIIIDDSTGVDFQYNNNTDASHDGATETRSYQLIVNKWEE
jgi:hypothetical protein